MITMTSFLYTIDPSTREFVFKYDGFISPNTIMILTPTLAQSPSIITSNSDKSGASSTVLNNFAFVYPSTPSSFKQVPVADVIIIRPNSETLPGNFGPKYKIGVKEEVINRLTEIGRKGGYNMLRDMEHSHDISDSSFKFPDFLNNRCKNSHNLPRLMTVA